MRIAGCSWVFGDGLTATDIVSAKYDKAGMSHDWAECRQHLLEDVDPAFSGSVEPGDILVAGKDLGRGHAHYYMAAVMACREAGIAAILCEGVNALFQRCAIDEGLLIWPLPGITAFVRTGDQLEFDPSTGLANNRSSDETAAFATVSPLIIDIVGQGGSLAWALARVGKAA